MCHKPFASANKTQYTRKTLLFLLKTQSAAEVESSCGAQNDLNSLISLAVDLCYIILSTVKAHPLLVLIVGSKLYRVNMSEAVS